MTPAYSITAAASSAGVTLCRDRLSAAEQAFAEQATLGDGRGGDRADGSRHGVSDLEHSDGSLTRGIGRLYGVDSAAIGIDHIKACRAIQLHNAPSDRGRIGADATRGLCHLSHGGCGLRDRHARPPHDERYRTCVVDAGNITDRDVGEVDAGCHRHRDRWTRLRSYRQRRCAWVERLYLALGGEVAAIRNDIRHRWVGLCRHGGWQYEGRQGCGACERNGCWNCKGVPMHWHDILT